VLTFFCEGSVVLSGFLNAARLSSSAAGTPISDQRILFFGAGSAGIGVAKQLMSFFTLLGMSEEEARSRIYVCHMVTASFMGLKLTIRIQTVDSKGLITADRKGLQEHKKC